jgi:hypothetical protein
MTFVKYFRKLMSWCPMKNSFGKGRREDCFSGFKLENGSQKVPSPADMQEKIIYNVQVSLFPELWAVIIILFALIISLLLWTYSPEDSFSIILSELILYLPLIPLLLSHRSSTVAAMPEKIIIKRPMRKTVVIEKEDIKQISIEKNENHSLRWLTRLVFLTTIPIILFRKIEWIIKDLQLEETASAPAKLGLFLPQFFVVTYLLVFYYNFELQVPYQRILKVTTFSNMKLWIYTEKPEEIIAILRNEKE